MKNALNDIQKIKENLEYAAFLVGKGSSERESHGKIVDSLIVLGQLESKLHEYSSNCKTSNSKISISGLQKEKSYSNFTHEKDDTSQEVKKVTRRLPRWFRNKSQNNSKILVEFLKLYVQNQAVDVHLLKGQCSSVRDFYGNYNQMKNFGEKNHGKVFEEKDGVIMLWEPVKDFILKLYDETCVQ
jgi:hypothetical protein